jgi:hypothetical protein
MALFRTEPRARLRRSVVETLTTPRLLALYEQAFGRLEPATKRRMLATAREHGWDRTWDTVARAA